MMDLDEIRRQLQGGTLGQLPEATSNTEPMQFSPLKAISHRGEWPPKTNSYTLAFCDTTGFVSWVEGWGETVKPRASIPVGLDIGRQIASMYTGIREVELLFTYNHADLVGRILMVHPCWVPGLKGETRPTDADKTCYHVEVEGDWTG